MDANTTALDWNTPADRAKLDWNTARSESFYVIYTADKVTTNTISNRKVDNLGENAMGWPLYGEWVKLIENYTSFADVEKILTVSGKENVRVLWAQQEGEVNMDNAVKSWI